MSSPGLQGYIDRGRPHAVNALLIDKLGTQEVLACACDDGDVLVYYTSGLNGVFKALAADEDYKPQLRPLIVRNVGRSAWGLAVHINARLLAVSCNTHDITVFAFALTDDSVLYNVPDTEWQYPGRGKDNSLVLRGHGANVPNIAFLNSDLDKEGRYLVSTDLTGLIILWDLREGSKAKQIEPSVSSVHQNPYSGWSVACLDPRSFLLTRGDSDFLGWKSERDTLGTLDITQSRIKVKDASIYYPEPFTTSPVMTDDGSLNDIQRRVASIRRHLLDSLRIQDRSRLAAVEDVQIPEETESSNEITWEQEANSIRSFDIGIVNDSEEFDEEDGYLGDDLEDEEDSDLHDMDFDDDSNLGFAADIIMDLEPSEPRPIRGFTWASRRATEILVGIIPTQSRTAGSIDASLLLDSDSLLANDGGSIVESEDRMESLSGSEEILDPPWDLNNAEPGPLYREASCQATPALITMDLTDIPFLILHTGQDFVSLQTSPFKTLTVISRDPCHQHLPQNMAWLLHHDRLHLTRTIPELHIVIVATATGRAAIYTMTRILSGTRLIAQAQDEYGLRLDCIIPFASQERRRERPISFLIGIAAAPIQGHETKSGRVISEQRWRLLLTYHDHTVLSYELWRNGATSMLNFV